MPSILNEALEWLDRAEQAREVAGQLTDPLPFISQMNPSYGDLTFEQLLIKNAIRRDTFFLLSVIR